MAPLPVLPTGALSLLVLVVAAALSLALAADLGLLILLGGLARVFSRAPQLHSRAGMLQDASLTVVIPTYNEAVNVEACVASVLACHPPCADWRVLVVDDRSTDATAELALATAEDCGAGPDRFSLLDAGPRPAAERWVGKNWACSRAMEHVDSDWVLFLDADVRLKPATLRRALSQASEEGADLFSLAPRLACGCLAEWMVQPIMASLLGLGFPIEAANDPADPTAFAAGPFMLFRRGAYEAVGGHRALAGEVVEDLALARRIKGAGLRLRYLLGLDALELRMYRDFASLWEGWSKNWFAGLDRSVGKALGASAVVLLLFSGPWLLTGTAALGLLLTRRPWAGATSPAGRNGIGPGADIGPLPMTDATQAAGGLADLAARWAAAGPELLQWTLLLTLAAALLGIALQLALRLWTRRRFQVPLTLWWLMGAGGLVVAALGPTSVWRSLTGRGWTWKGRSLAG
jgi:glycosyltransferase involved in cell wall biosynthesis